VAYMPFTLIFDRSGFPLVRHVDWQFHIALFPVSKYQFERFLSAAGPSDRMFTDDWYRDLLERNPRCGWHNWGKTPWRLFVSGMESEAVQEFLAFCGPGFRLPMCNEWAMLLDEARELHRFRDQIIAECARAPAPVRYWIGAGLFPLAHEGMLELVTDRGRMRCVGKPFYDYHPSLWNANTVRDINNMQDHLGAILGFRAVMERKSSSQGRGAPGTGTGTWGYAGID